MMIEAHMAHQAPIEHFFTREAIQSLQVEIYFWVKWSKTIPASPHAIET